MKTERLYLRFEAEVLKELRKMAKRRKVTLTTLVTSLIQGALELERVESRMDNGDAEQI